MPINQTTKKIIQLLAVALVILLVVVLTTAKVSRASATRHLKQQAVDSLTVYSSNLSSELDKYRAIPLLLAKHPLLTYVLNQPGNQNAVQAANELLVKFNHISRALDTYLLDSNGLTLAASNWGNDNTFIGEDLSFRPYFRDAIDLGTGYYFALGSTSLKRGYYFSAAINDTEDNAIGVLVVKINFERMEKTWSQARGATVAVTDEDGVIFISSRQDWVYRSLQAISPDRLATIKASRRYANQNLVPLDYTEVTTDNPSDRLLSMPDAAGKEKHILLLQSKSIPEKGWVLHIFSDYSFVTNRIREAVLTTLSLTAFALAILGIISIRRQGRKREEQIKLHAYAAMELQVKERTEELTAAHDNLVQAAKMAALGKMATSLSHELSQPLSAIRAYAENAQEYIKRDNVDSANSNLDLIISMGERMGAIMRNLKAFARKTAFRLEAVSLDNVIRETLTLMNPALQKAGVNIQYHPVPATINVQAEPVRLQQVFTNLIHNAIDAVRHTITKNIVISVKQHGDTISVLVADSGTGIPDDILEQLFEPFSSTKEDGEGLGLGLSISHGLVQEFGGTLSASNESAQGATFKVKLKLVKSKAGVLA